MPKLVNRAKVSTATTGTGTITLGAAADGFQTFAAAGVADGDTVRYVIEDGTAWEIGTGVYTATGTTLSRTPSESSNAGAAINLSGDAVIYVSALAADFPTVVSQAEAESGTATTERLWTAQRVAQAIAALGGGGGGGGSIDSGTSAERPASPLAPMLFYNTSLNGLELYYPNIDTWEVISTFTSQVDPTSDSGQALYTAPGTHTWICPANVYQVDVVCVGGGGSGAFRGRGGGSGSGGGGGGLGYANSISVTPGQSYTVVVGPGGAPIGTPYYGGVGNNGGNSYFISTGTVLGGGGKGGSRATLYVGGVGGSYFPLGGNGGNGGNGDVYRSAGGGGAGGYSGSGGAGGTATEGGVAGAAGTGGGGGGGGEGDYQYRGGGGGGVGLLGEGTSGTGGAGSATSHGTPGAGGSGGANGANSAGGAYGGGGAGGNYNTAGGSGTDGAVRIIWGPERAFPSTNTGDV